LVSFTLFLFSRRAPSLLNGIWGSARIEGILINRVRGRSVIFGREVFDDIGGFGEDGLQVEIWFGLGGSRLLTGIKSLLLELISQALFKALSFQLNFSAD